MDSDKDTREIQDSREHSPQQDIGIVYPVSFIMGIVTDPVVTVLPTEEPLTMPQSAEEITATFAGPPANLPAMQFAILMKSS